MKVHISKIIVGTRRREDMGDIQGLADSIQKYGLLHPVVIDNQNRLVAGGRRLAACALLGWQEIEARSLGELTENELRAIELEENLRRKDLTEIEKSKDMVELVQVVREQAKEESACTPGVQAVSNVKGVKIPGSYRDISERTGFPVQTIREAEQHVQAVDKYPDLEPFPKKEAIKEAKKLDTLPPEKVPEELEAFKKAQRFKVSAERFIEKLHLLAKKPPETYFEGMDNIDIAFESISVFAENQLKIIDKAIVWLQGFRSEYAKRIVNKNQALRRVK